MSSLARPLRYGIPTVLLAAAAAALALWFALGGGSGGGVGDGLGFKNTIQWTVYDAFGNVKAQDLIHNATTVIGRNQAMFRLIDDTTDPTAAGNGATGKFNNIAVIGPEADDNLTDGVPAASILAQVDGTNNADPVHMNPASGAFTDLTGTEDGNGSVTVTFLAQGIPETAVQLLLVSTAPEDTADNSDPGIAAGEIFASQTINTSLGDGETLTVTWTVDVD